MTEKNTRGIVCPNNIFHRPLNFNEDIKKKNFKTNVGTKLINLIKNVKLDMNLITDELHSQRHIIKLGLHIFFFIGYLTS